MSISCDDAYIHYYKFIILGDTIGDMYFLMCRLFSKFVLTVKSGSRRHTENVRENRMKKEKQNKNEMMV